LEAAEGAAKDEDEDENEDEDEGGVDRANGGGDEEVKKEEEEVEEEVEPDGNRGPVGKSAAEAALTRRDKKAAPSFALGEALLELL